MGDVPIEPSKVFVLIPEWVGRFAAALLDALGELDHLINRLLAVQPHDVVVEQTAAFLLVFLGPRGQHLDEHGHHDFGPALANERKRSVKIKKHVADVRARAESGTQFNRSFERRNGRHLTVSYPASPQKSIARVAVGKLSGT